MAKKTVISPAGMPALTSPLSRAIVVGDLVFVSGTGPSNNPATGAFDPDIGLQVRSCLETIKEILEAAGSSLSNVVAVTSYLKNASLFAGYNEEYRKFFPTDPPTRTTLQAELMRPDMLVEITATAFISR